MPIRLVWRTDVHLSDKAPSSRTDDWVMTVLEKLAFVGRVAEKVGASAVIDGGDFFHVKSPSKNSHQLLRRVIELHQQYPCPVYANIGNHDCVYGDLTYLHQQPLGVLFEAGIFKPLYNEHEAVFEKDGISVRVVGIPYHGAEYDLDRFRVEKKGEDYLVVAAHLYASPSGGSMYGTEDVVSYDDLLNIDADIVLFGHWHKDQDVVEKGGKTFVNIGSLTRGSLSDDEIERVPSCAVMSFVKNKYQVKKVPLPVKPAGEVFDLAGKIKKEERAVAMEEFVSTLHQEISSQSSVDIKEQVENLKGLPDLVKEKAILYLEQAKL